TGSIAFVVCSSRPVCPVVIFIYIIFCPFQFFLYRLPVYSFAVYMRSYLPAGRRITPVPWVVELILCSSYILLCIIQRELDGLIIILFGARRPCCFFLLHRIPISCCPACRIVWFGFYFCLHGATVCYLLIGTSPSSSTAWSISRTKPFVILIISAARL